MSKKRWLCLAVIVAAILVCGPIAKGSTVDGGLNVIDYAATLEPDVAGEIY